MRFVRAAISEFHAIIAVAPIILSLSMEPSALATDAYSAKDHARERGPRTFPTVTVDRRPVSADFGSIRRAIRNAPLEKTL